MMLSCNLRSRINNTISLLATSSLLMLSVACASEPGSAAGAPLGSGGTGPSVSPECTDTPACAGAEVDKNGNPMVCVQTLDADIISDQGAPVADFFAQICGGNVCKNAKTDATGHVHFVLCKNMEHPAFKVPGKSKYGSYAVPVTDPISEFGVFELVPLAKGAGQMESQPDKDATFASGGAVFVVSAGTEVKINQIDHPEPDDQMFRAAWVPTDAAPGLVAASPGLQLFYSLAPSDTQLSKPAQLTIPNSNKWAAGAAVEFYVQGAAGNQGPSGGWTSAGAGRVSDDGKTVSTDRNTGGIKVLSLIGVRLK